MPLADAHVEHGPLSCGECSAMSEGRKGPDGVFYCDACWDQWTLRQQWSRAAQQVFADRSVKALVDNDSCAAACGARRTSALTAVGYVTEEKRWYCDTCWGQCNGKDGEPWYRRWLELRWGLVSDEDALFAATSTLAVCETSAAKSSGHSGGNLSRFMARDVKAQRWESID
eukprot:gnl/TRDRNA2_/TRDRNA2_31307_c0_seq1.p1 gnl/TRDRNA2_/TRDRNA2_31307_c0~~gnl/TRDRNA2_/TRDRNA2_31307_c0_seq1.p1  ORF type:complete len:171 (+),score=20.27 gnl/TRDRNA2_/TRDRNA2_31307_c0_seq1:98-610(+)